MNVLAAYHRMIEPIRTVARGMGYAIAVHGSLARDIDLVAIPWVDKCESAPTLAAQILNVLKQEFGYAVWKQVDGDGKPWQLAGQKPHGRRTYSIVCAGTYVDLSIMPARYDTPHDETKP